MFQFPVIREVGGIYELISRISIVKDVKQNMKKKKENRLNSLLFLAILRMIGKFSAPIRALLYVHQLQVQLTFI